MYQDIMSKINNLLEDDLYPLIETLDGYDKNLLMNQPSA